MNRIGPIAGVGLRLNGEDVVVDAPPGERLSRSLRERLGARDVKVGCDAGDCGACTVLLDGRPVCACLTPTHQAEGAAVETLAGLARSDPTAHALGEAFQNRQAAQCGICTPGMMVAAVALLRATPRPTEEEIETALGGVLCRCTGYRKIIEAVAEAAVGAPPLESSGAVGASTRRLDGADKVAGRTAFGDDVAPADALVLRVVRSPHARAGFRIGDVDGYVAAHPGVRAVLTAADAPGRNAFGVIPAFVDQPVFAEGEARYRGEAVAAVVGDADAMAALDLDAFPVEWRPRKSAESLDEALADDASLVHQTREGNVMCGGFVSCGDAEAALARADVVVEGVFETSFVEHAYIEPEAGFARVVDGRVEIHACTQAPMMDRDAVAEILGVAPTDVRIVPTAVGGGFG
ncbi:MAG: 2Fe-2S iron-sulfur cluster-binding protein, partial [Pseudomonadota bacterium]